MPTPNSATSRPDLGTIAYEHAGSADQRGFIGGIVMPVFPSVEQSAEYPIIPIEAFLKDRETRRAPRSGYSRGDYKFEMGSFACKENGTEEPLDDREARLYRRYFDAEMLATQRATDAVLRKHERRVAELVMNPVNSIAANNIAAAAPWSDYVNADIRTDVASAKNKMRYGAGFMANALVVSSKLFEHMLQNQKFLGYLQPTTPVLLEPVNVQARLLAAYLNVPSILVGDALTDTAKKGKDFILDDVWADDYAALMKLSPGGINLQEPCFGRTFVWNGDSGELTTESYREEKIRSNIYRVRQDTDEGIVFKGANLLISGVI